MSSDSFKFYIQRIGIDDAPIDVEATFHCLYVKATGISENGKAKNIYTESYPETDRMRLYIPDEIAYDNTSIVISLLFPGYPDGGRMDVQDNERAFFEAVSGKKIEWHDNFRNRYVTLILIEAPKVTAETLYGGSRYRQMEYTFQNVYGRSFASSQITSAGSGE